MHKLVQFLHVNLTILILIHSVEMFNECLLLKLTTTVGGHSHIELADLFHFQAAIPICINLLEDLLDDET